MAGKPPVGPDAADPEAQQRTLQDALTAIEDLYSLTDPWVLYEDGGHGHTWPDFEKWDKQKEFRLLEAACLWVDEEPRLPLSFKSQIAFRKLEKALEEYRLSARRNDLWEVISDAFDLHEKGQANKANPNWVVTRSDLVTYAKTVGEKPRFLFPKERT